MVWPFDTEIEALNDLLDWFYNLYDLIIGIPWEIAKVTFAVMMAIFYPLIALFDVVYSFIQNQYEVLAAFINAVLGIPNMVYYTFDSFISMNFPPIIVWVLVTLIFLRTMQFIFKHVKGISILGFKIG